MCPGFDSRLLEAFSFSLQLSVSTQDLEDVSVKASVVWGVWSKCSSITVTTIFHSNLEDLPMETSQSGEYSVVIALGLCYLTASAFMLLAVS